MITLDYKKCRTALQRTYINYQAWARENNIYYNSLSLKPKIYGFVYLSSFDNYFIIINKNLTNELQKEVFCHEVEHIIYDMPKKGYIIGLNMQYSSLEKRADEFASEIMETAANFFG